MIKKFILAILFTLVLSGNTFSLSLDRERFEYQQCVKILVDAGKSFSKSNKYCLCSVKMTSAKYSDEELDKIVERGMSYLNKKTKSIAEKCANEANAK